MRATGKYPLRVAALCFALAAPPLFAQTPFASVPKFPTGCYSDNDTFNADLAKARNDALHAYDTQEAINKGIAEKFSGIPFAEKSTRMRAAMQKDPAGAMKIMTDQQDIGEKVNAARGAHATRMQAFDAEFKRLVVARTADRSATLDKPEAEVIAQRDPGSHGTKAQLAAAVARYNAAYVGFCAKWTQAGPFLPLLAKLRAMYVDDLLPVEEKLAANYRAQVEQAGIDAKQHQSSTAWTAVQEYMRFVHDVFSVREAHPTTGL